jgi:putative peptidoglycan lipid II flippase
VISAWCLGVLNSHRRFFLSYAAPVIWSVIQMAAMVAYGGKSDLPRLAEVTAYAAMLGAAAQFAIQLPTVLGVLGRFRPSVSLQRESTREVLHGFGPVVVGRGVVQISAYVDTYYASLISEVAFSALTYAQTLYLLPISLFGMAVSAAELPEMSRDAGSHDEVSARLRARIDAGLKRIAFFVVPSAAAFLFLGDSVAGAVLQTGRFKAGDTRLVWYFLMGSTVGLLAATFGRLYSSSFYALKDTRTPLYTAMARVGLTAALAYWSAVKLPAQLGVPREIGGVGITATTGVAAWVEFLLLRKLLTKRIGATGLARRTFAIYWGSAILGAALGLGVKAALLAWRAPMGEPTQIWGGWLMPAPALPPVITALATLLPFGLTYLGLTYALGQSELASFIRRRLKR